MNLVCGAGGSRAILGSSGAILACHFAGISDWRTVGGASGGSIPTVLLAAGYTPKDIAHYCIDIDYSALLTRHGGIMKVVSAYFFKDTFYRLARPKHGLFGSEKIVSSSMRSCPNGRRSFGPSLCAVVRKLSSPRMVSLSTASMVRVA